MAFDFEADKRESETARIRRRQHERDWRRFKIAACLIGVPVVVLIVAYLASE